MTRLQEAAKSPNIDKLYEKLFAMKEMLTEVIQTAQEAANDAGNFGGDISRVIPNQLRAQFVIGIQNFISQPGNPIAIDSIIQYLDSLPLSKVRVPRGEEALMQQGVPPNQQPPAYPPMTTSTTGIAPNAGSSIPPAPSMPPVNLPGERLTASAKRGEGQALQEGRSSKVQELQSAILRAKGQPLLDEARRMWEEEHPEEEVIPGSLDFGLIKEGYNRKPSTPEVFTKNNEDKIYERTLKKSQDPKERLQEADMLISPYPVREVSDMSGWRDLVEEKVLDEDINERLGAAAVATALLSEESQKTDIKKGLNRMRELVSSDSEPVAADAGDIAQLLVNEKLVDDSQLS